MLKKVVPASLVMLALVLATAWLLRAPDALPARYDHADCRRIELIDPRTGQTIVGAEDLALGNDGDTVYVSAHDRRDPAEPDGGLYSFSLWEVAGGGRVKVERLDLRRQPGVVFRPHGFALSPDGRQLAVINRIAEDIAMVEIGALSRVGWRPDRLFEDRRLCRANDLAYRNDGTLEVTLDRADCRPSLADLSPWSQSGSLALLDSATLKIERSRLGFANGLGAGAVAETRRNRLSWAGGHWLELPGGPDNITVAEDGALIVAVHPNLFRLFTVVRGWLDIAPSRILSVDPSGKRYQVLFDDPDGDLFSAATVAIQADVGLVLGSATDRGVLFCEGRR